MSSEIIPLDGAQRIIGLGKDSMSLIKEVYKVLYQIKHRNDIEVDEAFEAIRNSLDELIDFFKVIRLELSKIDKLSFNNPSSELDPKGFALDIVSGGFERNVRKAKISCDVFRKRWYGYIDKTKTTPSLQKWFEHLKQKKLITEEEYRLIQRNFEYLSGSDSDMINDISRISEVLKNEFGEIIKINDMQDKEKKLSLIKEQISNLQIQASFTFGDLQESGSKFSDLEQEYSLRKTQKS